jgi:uncharacterized protein YcbK (DUF882 family)|tara:strand:+ start:2129 stop:2479 length:351 start_codon:yes stop_codon:yes gene_type:complete
MRYFKANEFTCNGVNCFDKMQPSTLELLDDARHYAKIPFRLNSTWRSDAWNKEIKGAKNSAHLRGYAVDIKCTNSMDRFTIIKALLKAGYTRVGVASNFIHCDNDPSLAAGVIFLY